MSDLHISYLHDAAVRTRLDEWDAAIREEGQLREHNWGFLAVWEAARSATTSASTGIEGNPISPSQVDDLMAGQAIAAEDVHVREVTNYHRAMQYVHRVARRESFVWSHDVIHDVHALIMEGLPSASDGQYRDADVHVGSFRPPSGLVVQRYMDALVDWLSHNDEVPLIRVALLHLNMIAIHPFEDGNGRTARVLSSVELLRDGVHAPELISTEPYFRQHRDEYIDALSTTLGESYDAENHTATHWIDYFTRISLDRLSLRNRIRDAVPNDVGRIHLALLEAGQPPEWTPIILAASIMPIRTRLIAEWMGRSDATARALLARISDAGWLTALGRTRARRYVSGPRVDGLALRVPDLTDRLRAGDSEAQLDLWSTSD